jgi:hypothetical protein
MQRLLYAASMAAVVDPATAPASRSTTALEAGSGRCGGEGPVIDGGCGQGEGESGAAGGIVGGGDGAAVSFDDAAAEGL